MKTNAFYTAGLLAFTFIALPASAAPTGCAAKKQDIEQQIDYAKQHGNTQRLAGLQKALAEVNDHCTDSGLLTQRQARVAEKQSKVAERERELMAAQNSGSQKKIAKKQEKLDEARDELKEAQDALNK
ncbi:MULTISPECIES: DUF1090 domain-containing protein [Erwinia]|uniref:DUF1090 domain-containing protein n=1 Tax=Erwinia TaxID=551 RepID=UPI0005589F2E|nr:MULTISPECIES: DUF1090 domain-containing protein [Erwinia]